MNVDLELYRVFYITAQTQNITKTAQILHVSQPAITKSIKNLENSLGGQLFIRTTRGVVLTDDGKSLFNHIEKAMKDISNAENSFSALKKLESGKIKIGASTTITKHFLLGYLEKYHKLYPNVKIEIVNDLTKNLISNLKNGEVDLLVLNLPTSDDLNIKIIPCMEVQDIFVGSKEWHDKYDGYSDLKTLSKNLITQKKPSNTRSFLDEFAFDNNIILEPLIEAVSYGLVMDLTKIGLGVGYATKEFILDELENNLLYEIKISEKIKKRQIGIAVRANSVNSFSTDAFINLILNKN